MAPSSFVRRGVAALVLCAGLASPPAPAAPALAPAWQLQTPDGQTIRYPDDAHGEPTILLFWPSWCPYSRALQPYVQDIWRDYRERGVHSLDDQHLRRPAIRCGRCASAACRFRCSSTAIR
ncbi:MAG: redoxin domain-containing protein [Solimonas sp.]